jgi:hypothetical protein
MLRRHSSVDEPTPLLRSRSFLIPHLIHPTAPRVSEWLEEVADPFPVDHFTRPEDDKGLDTSEERLKLPSTYASSPPINHRVLKDASAASTLPVQAKTQIAYPRPNSLFSYKPSGAPISERQASPSEHSSQASSTIRSSAIQATRDLENRQQQTRSPTSSSGCMAGLYGFMYTLSWYGRAVAVALMAGVIAVGAAFVRCVNPRTGILKLIRGFMFVVGIKGYR